RTSPDLPAPDVQLHAIPGLLSEDPAFAIADHGISIGVCLLTPQSAGELYLSTPEPTAKPAIFHRYFEAEEDRVRMEAALALALAERAADLIRGKTPLVAARAAAATA